MNRLSRPILPLFLAGLILPASADVVINEVHYAPEPKTAKVEFIELHNSGLADVDLTGWRMSGGIDFVFPAGVTLAAGGYLLLCQDLGAVTAIWFPPVGQETAVVYDYSNTTGSATTGTTLAGQDNWLQPAGGTQLKSRNDPTLPGLTGNRGYSNTSPVYGTRNNNAAFSYAIPATATTLRLSAAARLKSTVTASFGPGVDANGNNRIDSADGLGEYGFEFGCANNAWFVRQAAQGPVTSSASIGLSSGSEVWYLELRVDLLANGGDGAASLFVQKRADTTNTAVTDTLKPVPTLQNVNIGLSRMSANGGNSSPSAWNGILTNLGNGHLDNLTIAHAAPVANPNPPVMLQLTGTLSNEGETLNLRNAADSIVDTVSYQPEFPWPVSAAGSGSSMQLIHPALDNDLGGSWRGADPTPGAQNSVYAANAPPQLRQVTHTPAQPLASQPTLVTVKATDPGGIGSLTLIYQLVTPGNYLPAWLPHNNTTLLATPNAPLAANPAFEDAANWTALPMNDAGHSGDAIAADGIFSATVPAQPHRTLVRYRISATDTSGASVRVPYPDDPSLNFAYLSYNGVPDWTAATRSVHPEGAGHVYPAAMLTTLPVHTLITRNADWLQCYAYSSLGNTSWQIPKSNTEARSAFNWEAAFVYDGIVYDHIRYRLRQSNDRYYGNGKRSMRFRFNDGHQFQARDEEGNKLPYKWAKLNTAKMSRFGGGTEYGVREIMNSRLWKMFGVDVPRYYHAHLRVIDGSDEAPAGTDGQYLGDFFGLAMFYEDFDGAFLDNRKLAKGNIYKWKDGISNASDLQQYQARDAVTDYSDFATLKAQLRPESDDPWLRSHVDWNQWYHYHAICEAIRHYDFGWQSSHWKNRGWYFQPAAGAPLGLLRHIPHDHDASWYVGYHDGLTVGIGEDFAKHAIFTAPAKTAYTVEYRNVMRECRDLLWKAETVNDMIDRITATIAAFSLADRDRWLSAPPAAGYETSMDPLETLPPELKSFAFTADTVNGATLAGGRGAYLDQLANDPAIPLTPTISYAGVPAYPINGIVLQTSDYAAASPNSFGAIQWRLAEVTDSAAPAYDAAAPMIYEITPVWDSGGLGTFEDQVEVPLLAVRSGHSYRARVRHQDSTGRWSHWSAPLQFTATSPDVSLYQKSLVISEIMYHPAGDLEDREFVEVMNIGPLELDLTPVRFTKGVDFDFAGSAITSLAPGARVLVVRNRAAFEAAHGTGLPVAGEYRANAENNLSNGGEQLKLSYGTGIAIRDFVYGDLPPWPTTPDGAGPSLVLINPDTFPDHNLATNWRASSTSGGNPGTSDAPKFTGDPAADEDRDGMPALVEFALGGSDADAADVHRLPRIEWVTIGGETYPALVFEHPREIQEAAFILETSADLATWTPQPVPNEASPPQPPGAQVPVVFRSPFSRVARSHQFLRLRIELAAP